MSLAARLDRAVRLAGVAIEGVSIGNEADRATWRVHPSSLQTAAQPTIDPFDPDDPAHAVAELADLSLEGSRDKNRLALCAVIVRERNIAAWNAMTPPQKVAAVLAVADLWKTFREFIDDKV